MNRSRYRDSGQRFYRGYRSTTAQVGESEWAMRPCGCGYVHLAKIADPEPECFACSQRRNPPKTFNASVSAEGEDSTNPERVADGTAQFNVGLRGIDTVVGTNPDGTKKLAYRPVTHNELATARARREYAKRTGVTPLASPKRAIGGHS